MAFPLSNMFFPIQDQNTLGLSNGLGNAQGVPLNASNVALFGNEQAAQSSTVPPQMANLSPEMMNLMAMNGGGMFALQGNGFANSMMFGNTQMFSQQAALPFGGMFGTDPSNPLYALFNMGMQISLLGQSILGGLGAGGMGSTAGGMNGLLGGMMGSPAAAAATPQPTAGQQNEENRLAELIRRLRTEGNQQEEQQQAREVNRAPAQSSGELADLMRDIRNREDGNTADNTPSRSREELADSIREIRNRQNEESNNNNNEGEITGIDPKVTNNTKDDSSTAEIETSDDIADDFDFKAIDESEKSEEHKDNNAINHLGGNHVLRGQQGDAMYKDRLAQYELLKEDENGNTLSITESGLIDDNGKLKYLKDDGKLDFDALKTDYPDTEHGWDPDSDKVVSPDELELTFNLMQKEIDVSREALIADKGANNVTAEDYEKTLTGAAMDAGFLDFVSKVVSNDNGFEVDAVDFYDMDLSNFAYGSDKFNEMRAKIDGKSIDDQIASVADPDESVEKFSAEWFDHFREMNGMTDVEMTLLFGWGHEAAFNEFTGEENFITGNYALHATKTDGEFESGAITDGVFKELLAMDLADGVRDGSSMRFMFDQVMDKVYKDDSITIDMDTMEDATATIIENEPAMQQMLNGFSGAIDDLKQQLVDNVSMGDIASSVAAFSLAAACPYFAAAKAADVVAQGFDHP